MKSSSNIGILLAAGAGTRISELTNDPKSLLKINGKTLIDWHLAHMEMLNFKKIIIITGYKHDKIKNYVEQITCNIEIKIIKNQDFDIKGNTFSMYMGLKNADDNVLIIDADLVYTHNIISSYMKLPLKNSILVGNGDINDEECAKTLIDNDGYVKKTIDKRNVSRYEINRYNFLGEAIGMIRISKDRLDKIINECDLFFQDDSNYIKNWEHLMNRYFKNNKIKPAFEKCNSWIEIDTLEDYENARKLFKNIKLIS
jgi:choline kinase